MTRRDFSSTLEAELFELFKPYRPDPQAFREGVQKRIAKLRAERGDLEESDAPPDEHDAKLETRQAPAWVRKAASFLPPDFGSLLLSSGKGWSAALLLPALTLGALFGAFFMGKRSIARSMREAAPAPAPPPRRGYETLPNREQRMGSLLADAARIALLVLAAFGFAGSFSGVDVFLVVLLASTFAMTLQIRGAARAGTLDRDSVSALCGGIIFTMWVGCWFLANPRQLAWQPDSVLGAQAALVVVVTAIVATVALVEGLRPSRVVRVVAACGFWLALSVPVLTLSGPGRVRAFVESQTLDASRERAWSEVAGSVEALRDVGVNDLDLSRMRAEFERAIRHGWNAQFTAWTAGARTGTIDREHWRLLAARPEHARRLRALIDEDGPLFWPASYTYEYVLSMLLATHELTDDERVRLTERVVQSWPGPEHIQPLGRMKQCVQWFDLLGRSDLVDARRAEIRQLISRYQVRDSERRWWRRPGAFRAGDDYPTSVEATVDAVELMARVGPPDDVDLRRVRGYLRSHAAREGLFSDDDPVRKAPARAALLRLERQIGLPERSWLEALVAERLLIGVLLLVALCWTAIASAPPGPEHALRLARRVRGS